MTESIRSQMMQPDNTFGPVVTEDSPVQDIARAFVFDFARSSLDPSDSQYAEFTFDDVDVVQFFYILGNWKALVSTTLPDGMYYEVSYEKSRSVARLEAYKRFDHKEVSLPWLDNVVPFESRAKGVVMDYIRGLRVLVEDRTPVSVNTYSFAYVYGTWKSLLATNLDDGMYYEVTYGALEQIAYLDPYKLFEMKEFAVPARRGSD